MLQFLVRHFSIQSSEDMLYSKSISACSFSSNSVYWNIHLQKNPCYQLWCFHTHSHFVLVAVQNVPILHVCTQGEDFSFHFCYISFFILFTTKHIYISISLLLQYQGRRKQPYSKSSVFCSLWEDSLSPEICPQAYPEGFQSSLLPKNIFSKQRA